LITGKLSDSNLQIKYIENKNIIKALKYIENTNFSSFSDNIYELEGKNLFFILSSYKTVTSISEKQAEVHRKYLDLQYLLYGKECIGYANYSNIKKNSSEYDSDKDIELFESVENESFLTLTLGYYAIFFPEDIHRPGLCKDTPANIRKVVFKILISNDRF